MDELNRGLPRHRDSIEPPAQSAEYSPQVKAREQQCHALLDLPYGPPIAGAEVTEMDSG